MGLTPVDSRTLGVCKPSGAHPSIGGSFGVHLLGPERNAAAPSRILPTGNPTRSPRPRTPCSPSSEEATLVGVS